VLSTQPAGQGNVTLHASTPGLCSLVLSAVQIIGEEERMTHDTTHLGARVVPKMSQPQQRVRLEQHA
jgi:hypothetical protein